MLNVRVSVVLAACLLALVTLSAQRPGRPSPPQAPPPQRPQQPGGGGPYSHQVKSATSVDGLRWTHDGRVLLEHASVPSAIVTPQGVIRIYYVDATRLPETTNCAESIDGGVTFRVRNCVIGRQSRKRALDPSIVRLPDGRYRLYYLAVDLDFTVQPHAIFSAVSDDGIRFTEEGAVFSYPELVDPDVFWSGREWLMFVFAGREGTIVAQSNDGRSFRYSGSLGLPGWGTTAPVALKGGVFRLYAFDQRTSQTVVSFTSVDGLNWSREEGTRLTAPDKEELTDPFVVPLSDGTWKMIYKSSRRRDRQRPDSLPASPQTGVA